MDVRLVPDDTDLPRLAFCRVHEQVVVDFLRSLVRPEHVPPPPPPGPTYYYRVTYKDKDGNEGPADRVVRLGRFEAPVIDWSWPRLSDDATST